MSWFSEWRESGKIRLPKKYNSIGDIRKALREDLTPEKKAKIVAGINQLVDVPGLDEQAEEKLIETILAYGLQALLGD